MTNSQSKIQICSENFPTADILPEVVKEKLFKLREKYVNSKINFRKKIMRCNRRSQKATVDRIKMTSDIHYDWEKGLFFIDIIGDNFHKVIWENGCINDWAEYEIEYKYEIEYIIDDLDEDEKPEDFIILTNF